MSALNGLNVAPNPNDGLNSVVPIGSMILFGVNTPPSGWLLCDGSALLRSVYPALYNVIGTTWGAGDGSVLTITNGVSGGGATTYTLTVNNTSSYIAVGTTFVLSSTGQASFDGNTFTAIAPTNTTTITFASSTLTTITSGYVTKAVPTTFNIPNTINKTLRGAKTGTLNPAVTGGADTKTITADNLPQHTHGITSFALTGANGTGGGSLGVNSGQYYTAVGQTYLNDTTRTAVTNSALDVVNAYVAIPYIIKYA